MIVHPPARPAEPCGECNPSSDGKRGQVPTGGPVGTRGPRVSLRWPDLSLEGLGFRRGSRPWSGRLFTPPVRPWGSWCSTLTPSEFRRFPDRRCSPACGGEKPRMTRNPFRWSSCLFRLPFRFHPGDDPGSSHEKRSSRRGIGALSVGSVSGSVFHAQSGIPMACALLSRRAFPALDQPPVRPSLKESAGRFNDRSVRTVFGTYNTSVHAHGLQPSLRGGGAFQSPLG